MKKYYCLNNTIDLYLWKAKLTARNNCFNKIQSILVETSVEKPPNSFLADRLDGFSIFIKHIPAPANNWGQ